MNHNHLEKKKDTFTSTVHPLFAGQKKLDPFWSKMKSVDEGLVKSRLIARQTGRAGHLTRMGYGNHLNENLKRVSSLVSKLGDTKPRGWQIY